MSRTPDSISLHALPRAHPFNWLGEARECLLFGVLMPAMALRSVAEEAGGGLDWGEPSGGWDGPGGGSGGGTGGAWGPAPGPDPDRATRRVAEAFFAHYAQLEVAPRVHLGLAVYHPLVESAAGGLEGRPTAGAGDGPQDEAARLVGRGIRAAAVQAARRFRGWHPSALVQPEPPELTLILDRLHTALANAAVYFYHRHEAEVYAFLLDRQLVELLLEG